MTEKAKKKMGRPPALEPTKQIRVPISLIPIMKEKLQELKQQQVQQ
jgi:hypothetical protein